MNKSTIITAITAAISLTSVNSLATNDDNMEKCIINKNGKSLIKEHKADCNSGKSSCAGQNIKGDPTAWIFIPKGECAKINAGDFSGVSQDIKNKIEGAN